MTRKRRNHSSEFKAKVALAAAKGDKKLYQSLAPRHPDSDLWEVFTAKKLDITRGEIP
jgi:hypothetical protein